ncbi:hypothetical protein JOB18_037348 [Solea senegalensis]|uniref:Uncharacterized protein n=1 Tax=Solea senegalensis TaxID=28829 RepID=A0AAV6QRF6_SOLSE|nr:hypothetical protein JOB18_037348 [Solea senegalensis]
MNKEVVVFLKQESDVAKLMESGLVVSEEYIQVSPLAVPSTRITVSHLRNLLVPRPRCVSSLRSLLFPWRRCVAPEGPIGSAVVACAAPAVSAGSTAEVRVAPEESAGSVLDCVRAGQEAALAADSQKITQLAKEDSSINSVDMDCDSDGVSVTDSVADSAELYSLNEINLFLDDTFAAVLLNNCSSSSKQLLLDPGDACRILMTGFDEGFRRLCSPRLCSARFQTEE